MPRNLKRNYGRGDLHFVTFSCYRRLPLLRTIHARNLFVRALGAIRERYKFLLVGYVVMPDHVHLLISEPPKIDTFGNAEGAQAASFPRFPWEKTQTRQRAVTVALHEQWFGLTAFRATTLLCLQRGNQLQRTRRMTSIPCNSHAP